LGIELARAHRPHLILLDINMPGMNGYEVLNVLSNRVKCQAVKGWC
jgi:CheY-like chemotaxis protein